MNTTERKMNKVSAVDSRYSSPLNMAYVKLPPFI